MLLRPKDLKFLSKVKHLLILLTNLLKYLYQQNKVAIKPHNGHTPHNLNCNVNIPLNQQNIHLLTFQFVLCGMPSNKINLIIPILFFLPDEIYEFFYLRMTFKSPFFYYITIFHKNQKVRLKCLTFSLIHLF